MGRVARTRHCSEPQAVEVRYSASEEEHPGAADRTVWKQPFLSSTSVGCLGQSKKT